MDLPVNPDFCGILQLPNSSADCAIELFKPSKAAMSSPWPTCGPVKGFVRPSLVFAVAKVPYILTSYSCFGNLDFDIFEASGLQCHFITSVTVAYSSVFQPSLHHGPLHAIKKLGGTPNKIL